MTFPSEKPNSDERIQAPSFIFIGSTNAMPMNSALSLRRRGFQVRYVVDAEPEDRLHRPESHFTEIDVPYPPWIGELTEREKRFLQSPRLRILSLLFPGLFFRRLIREASSYDVAVLNDYGIDLARHISKKATCVMLSSGGDFDMILDSITNLLRSCRKFPSVWKIVVLRCTGIWRRRIGVSACEYHAYFVDGLNPKADHYLSSNFSADRRIPRLPDFKWYHEQAVAALREENDSRDDSASDWQSNSLNVLIPVRFFESPSKSRSHQRKGTLEIVAGVINFIQGHPDMSIHVTLFRKGDSDNRREAEQLIAESNVGAMFHWIDPVDKTQLFDMMRNADIVFDQIGDHWPGDNAWLALSAGATVMCNDRWDVYSRFIPTPSPFICVRSASDVTYALESFCQSDRHRVDVHTTVEYLSRLSQLRSFNDHLSDLAPDLIGATPRSVD